MENTNAEMNEVVEVVSEIDPIVELTEHCARIVGKTFELEGRIDEMSDSMHKLEGQVTLVKYGICAVVVVGVGIWIKNKLFGKKKHEGSDAE